MDRPGRPQGDNDIVEQYNNPRELALLRAPDDKPHPWFTNDFVLSRMGCGIKRPRHHATNAAAGRLASGTTLHMFGNEARKVFGEEFDKAAQFVFNLTGGNAPEVIGALDYFAGRVVDLMEKLVLCGRRTGIAEATVVGEINNIRVSLSEMRTRRVGDFTHGIMGNERMKKDPIIGIINTQSNSPGAIQQVGVGEFSQSAFVQHHQQLVAAIGRALALPEFQQLQQAQREGFRDIADVVKGEATKPSPDPSKLKRWSERLLGMGREIGMRMAVSEIGQAIAHIFGSAV